MCAYHFCEKSLHLINTFSLCKKGFIMCKELIDVRTPHIACQDVLLVYERVQKYIIRSTKKSLRNASTIFEILKLSCLDCDNILIVITHYN